MCLCVCAATLCGPSDAEVLFDYEPTETDELKLNVGDTVKDVKKVLMCEEGEVRVLYKDVLACRLMMVGMRES